MTIKEVAQLAGVSPAAVSRYLNGGSLSMEKSEQIRKVIEETGYHPSQAAQLMRTGRSGQIGVLIPKVSSSSVAQMVDGIFEKLQEKNCMALLGVTSGQQNMELEYLEAMQHNPVDGVILMGTVMTPILRDAILHSQKPVVVTGQNFDGIPCVYHDDFGAMEELTNLFLSKGKKKLVYIGALEEDLAVGAARRKGVESAWQKAGLPLKDLREKVAHFSSDSGQICMEELLTENSDIDGVICATDRIALGASVALRNAGKRVPEDVSLAGVGDSWAGSILVPGLTTVHLFFRECGAAAAEMLLQRIEAEPSQVPITQMKLEYKILERGSL